MQKQEWFACINHSDVARQHAVSLIADEERKDFPFRLCMGGVRQPLVFGVGIFPREMLREKSSSLAHKDERKLDAGLGVKVSTTCCGNSRVPVILTVEAASVSLPFC